MGLDTACMDGVRAFMDAAFAGKQGIPAAPVLLPGDRPAHWRCARIGEYVVGAAACWFKGERRHWGRIVVDPDFRGLGIGGRLDRFSLDDLFGNVADAVVVVARDITVAIL